MNITIRDITPSDYTSAAECICKTIRISQATIYPPRLRGLMCRKYESDNFSKKAQEIRYFVAIETATGRLVGIIGLKDNQLRTFFVDPDWQRKGIGRKLYNHLESVAKEQGVTSLTLEGSPLGQPVYLSFGFRHIQSVQKEKEGIPYTDALMEKHIG